MKGWFLASVHTQTPVISVGHLLLKLPAFVRCFKSSLGTAARGGAVFQKSRATNPEKKSIGSTATVELTMLAEAPPRTELPTVASAFCVAHISPSDLPAALRERLALRRIRGSSGAA